MTSTDISVKMVLDRWYGSIQNLDKHLNELTDSQLQNEVAPGKNRGTYLLGHLIAVHDDMLILLNMGEKLFPELHEPYIKQPDAKKDELLSANRLRAMWKKQNEALQIKFSQLKTEDWFERHTAVSEADFAQEPHRNKLNIIITRTSHLQYHSGQIVLLK